MLINKMISLTTVYDEKDSFDKFSLEQCEIDNIHIRLLNKENKIVKCINKDPCKSP